MLKSLSYSPERITLAMYCFEELGLKDLPLSLMDLAVKVSDIPSKDRKNSQQESSLLSIGNVYSYGDIVKFIARDGHTYILPCNNIVLSELEKCGYVICAYGSNTPVPISNEIDDEDVFGLNLQKMEEDKYRKKVTLSSGLVAAIVNLESDYLPACDIQRNSNGEYTYDVFSPAFCIDGDFSHYSLQNTIAFYGFESDVVRKLLAINGYGNNSMKDLPHEVDSLVKFLIYAYQNNCMNKEIYFSEDGPYSSKFSTGSGAKSI